MSHPRRIGATLAAATAMVAAAAVAPGLTAPASGEHQARGTASRAAGASARRRSHVLGSLWVDCRRDGHRAAQDPPVRGAVVELVTASGQLSTTVTNRAGDYAFKLSGDPPSAVVVPLIQAPLDALVPSRTSGSQPLPGRSVGRRVADLDRVAVSAAGARSSKSRYDFGFVAAIASGQALTRAGCPRR